jgi:hypothetical protein
MSDDTLNVDSVEELPTEETVGTDDAASQETTDESSDGEVVVPKGKEKALRDTDTALKEKQAEFTKMSQQLAELKGQFTTLMQLQQKPKQEEVKDWMEELNSDKVVEDPLAAIKMVVANLRKELAGVFSDRDAFLLSKMGGSRIDPELQSKVDELKSDPDFADLPAEKLVAIAKKMSMPKKAVKDLRGSVGGGGRGAPSGTRKDGDLTAEEMAWLRASGTLKTNKRDDTLE